MYGIIEKSHNERGNVVKYLKNDKFLKYCRFVPIIITSVMMIMCIVFFAGHDFNEILAYTPDNRALAAVVFLGFFVFKSVSVVFPLAAIFIATGLVYPIYISIPLNILGLALCFTVPYLVGRFAGGDLLEIVVKRFPKAKKFVEYSHRNNLFASYITRAVVIVPGDIASIVFGTLKMPYRPYLLGSILGVFPEMVVETYIGGNLRDLTARSVIVMAAMILATMALTFALNKKISRKGREYDKKDF